MCFANKIIIIICKTCQNFVNESNIVTMGSKKTSTDKVHAAGSIFADFAAFHQRASASITDALAELSRSYPALGLKAALIIAVK